MDITNRQLQHCCSYRIQQFHRAELHYIFAHGNLHCTGNTPLLNWVSLLKQISQEKKIKIKIEVRMEEKPAWSSQLSAERRHVPANPSSRRAAVHTTQPCVAKTGHAEGHQPFSSLRPKAKLNQPPPAAAEARGPRGPPPPPPQRQRPAKGSRAAQRHPTSHGFTSDGSARSLSTNPSVLWTTFPGLIILLLILCRPDVKCQPARGVPAASAEAAGTACLAWAKRQMPETSKTPRSQACTQWFTAPISVAKTI